MDPQHPRPGGPAFCAVAPSPELAQRWRTGYDRELPGEGLLVWHVDESRPDNTDENHYRIALLQADGRRDLELTHTRGDAGDPYPGEERNTSLTPTTTPSTRAWSGAPTDVSITSISAPAAVMTAVVRVDSTPGATSADGPPAVRVPSQA